MFGIQRKKGEETYKQTSKWKLDDSSYLSTTEDKDREVG